MSGQFMGLLAVPFWLNTRTRTYFDFTEWLDSTRYAVNDSKYLTNSFGHFDNHNKHCAANLVDWMHVHFLCVLLCTHFCNCLLIMTKYWLYSYSLPQECHDWSKVSHNALYPCQHHKLNCSVLGKSVAIPCSHKVLWYWLFESHT